MSLAFLSPARTILLISDEVLSIFKTSSKNVSLVETVPWDVENFEKNVANIIAKDCGGKPVLILNDTVEQHYRKERVPKVSALDKANVIKRKLKVAFPNYDIRAALPLKEKGTRTPTGLSSSVFIFAAIPATENFKRTIDAVSMSLASIIGVCLLPVEASDMVKTLAAKTSKEKKSRWAVFIGQHKNGSLRQVVVKDGELALTRMTPIVETDEDPHQWAQELNQEFNATMSYLSRFGYAPDDGLDVIVIANEQAGESLGNIIDASCNYTSLNVAQAASLLGVPLGRQEGGHYADILHAAWAGKKKSLILPMSSKHIASVSTPRKAALAASVLLVLSMGYFAFQLVSEYQGVDKLGQEVKEANLQKTQLDNQYQIEIGRKKEMGFDVELVQNSLIVYDDFEIQKMDVLQLAKGIGDALGRELRIDTLSVQAQERIRKETNPRARRSNTPPPATPKYDLEMRLTYPSTADVEKGNQEVRELRDRLAANLPEHKVTINKLLKDYEYTQQIVVEAGDLQQNVSQQDFTVVLNIEGPPQEFGAGQ